MHIGDLKWLDRLCQSVPDYVIPLIEQLWPGPLTLILPKSDRVSALITAGQDTVAIRMPNHPIMSQILNGLDIPLVAPSANRYCQTSPTQASHVEKGLGADTAVVDGGPCTIGIESTIADCTDQHALTVLRPGIISADYLSTITGLPCHRKASSSIKSPGSHHTHYAPNTPLRLIDSPEQINDSNGHACCLMLTQYTTNKPHQVIMMPNDPKQYAAQLYQLWHQADQDNVDVILIEKPPRGGEWAGVHDCLNKAAAAY